MPHHPIHHPSHRRRKPVPRPVPVPQPTPKPQPGPSPGIAWPTFQGTATLVGTSPSGMVSVYYDATLGASALQNAQSLLNYCDQIVGLNDDIFSITQDVPVNVILFAMGGATDGSGGADHATCSFTTGGNIEVCVAYNNTPLVCALFEAELSECAMNGNLCGESNGEALSRWSAMLVANKLFGTNPLLGFASAPTWAQDGFANWVDTTEDTDQDYDSIGCGMAFISWMLGLGETITQIATAMVTEGDNGTLAEVYESLQGGPGTASPWPKFLAACQAVPGGITTDDPFDALPTAMV